MKEKVPIGENKEIAEIPKKGFEYFKEQLLKQEWKTSVDGDDYCRDCWPDYVDKIKEKYGDEAGIILHDAMSTSEVAKVRKCKEGWLVICEGCGIQCFSEKGGQ